MPHTLCPPYTSVLAAKAEVALDVALDVVVTVVELEPVAAVATALQLLARAVAHPSGKRR